MVGKIELLIGWCNCWLMDDKVNNYGRDLVIRKDPSIILELKRYQSVKRSSSSAISLAKCFVRQIFIYWNRCDWLTDLRFEGNSISSNVCKLHHLDSPFCRLGLNQQYSLFYCIDVSPVELLMWDEVPRVEVISW